MSKTTATTATIFIIVYQNLRPQQPHHLSYSINNLRPQQQQSLLYFIDKLRSYQQRYLSYFIKNLRPQQQHHIIFDQTSKVLTATTFIICYQECIDPTSINMYYMLWVGIRFRGGGRGKGVRGDMLILFLGQQKER